MKAYLPTSFLLFVFLIGCSENPSGPSGPIGVILPLTVGNTWEYEQAYISPYDQTANKDTISLSIFDSTIMQDSVVLYYATDGAAVYNDAKGLWKTNEFGNSIPILLAKYPGYPGEIFNRITVYVGSGDSATANLTIESTLAFVEVPAGSFACYKYTADYISKKTGKIVQRIHAYYAPNIGLIKQDLYLQVGANGNLALILERRLLSYTLID